jgi:hypothetical protein
MVHVLAYPDILISRSIPKDGVYRIDNVLRTIMIIRADIFLQNVTLPS